MAGHFWAPLDGLCCLCRLGYLGMKAASILMNFVFHRFGIFWTAVCPIVPYFLCRLLHDWHDWPHLVKLWESGPSWSEDTQVQMSSMSSICQRGLKRCWKLLLFIREDKLQSAKYIFLCNLFIESFHGWRFVWRLWAGFEGWGSFAGPCFLVVELCVLGPWMAEHSQGLAQVWLLKFFDLLPGHTPFLKCPGAKCWTPKLPPRLCL